MPAGACAQIEDFHLEMKGFREGRPRDLDEHWGARLGDLHNETRGEGRPRDPDAPWEICMNIAMIIPPVKHCSSIREENMDITSIKYRQEIHNNTLRRN